MRRNSLFKRLMWLVGIPIMVVWLATGIWIVERTMHETSEMFDQELLRTAASVLAVMPVVLGDSDSDTESASKMVEFDADDDSKPAITLRDAQGRVVLYNAHMPALAFDPGDPHFHSVTHQKKRWRVYQRWDARHRYWIQIAVPLDERDELLGHLIKAVVVPLLGLLVAVPLAIMAGLRFGLAPLHRLSREIKQNPEQTPTLSSEEVPVELATLTRALDALVASLAKALDRERRFTADAAHELRHPLAVLRIELDLAGASVEDGERHRHLQRAQAGLARMERLVTQLLTLARVETLTQLEDAAPAWLHEVAANVLRAASQRAAQRGVELSLDVCEEVRVHGSEGLLTIAIQNLIDNAIRHARDQGAVNVEVTRDGEYAALIVTDDGAGFSDAHLPRLGERFHRPEGSIGVGSGLGLSIARAIAALHQGDIAVGDSPLGGGRVVFRLPRASVA